MSGDMRVDSVIDRLRDRGSGDSNATLQDFILSTQIIASETESARNKKLIRFAEVHAFLIKKHLDFSSYITTPPVKSIAPLKPVCESY